MVRGCAIGPGSHDHEVHCLVPFVDDRSGDVGTDLTLGASGSDPLPHACMHSVDRLTRFAKGDDLVGGLADA